MLPIRVETTIAAALRDPPPLYRTEPLSPPAGSTAKTVSLPKRKPAAAVAPVESVASNASVTVDGSEFDQPPEPHLDNRKPPYPPEALTRGIQGVVMLRLRINLSGRVENAIVVESSGAASLDESARRTALQWRFQPARLRGANVVAMIEKPIRFTLRISG